jgi:hypothetical protein
MIPFMPFLAAYRVQKLRRAFIIYAIAVAIWLSIIAILYLAIDTRYSQLKASAENPEATRADRERSESFGRFYDDFRQQTIPSLVWLSLYPGSSLVMVYFIRKWSMRWNEEIALLQYLH